MKATGPITSDEQLDATLQMCLAYMDERGLDVGAAWLQQCIDRIAPAPLDRVSARKTPQPANG